MNYPRLSILIRFITNSSSTFIISNQDGRQFVQQLLSQKTKDNRNFRRPISHCILLLLLRSLPSHKLSLSSRISCSRSRVRVYRELNYENTKIMIERITESLCFCLERNYYSPDIGSNTNRIIKRLIPFSLLLSFPFLNYPLQRRI